MSTELSNRAITNAIDNESKPRHRWYPIKEGFSADLVSDSVDELKGIERKSIVGIEPFSGSGTAPLQFALLGIRSLAFEVNPFLAFVSRTKVIQTSPKELGACLVPLIKGLATPKILPLENYSTFCDGDGKRKWLFNREVLRSFGGGWDVTKKFGPAEQSLSRLALIRGAMDNCNAAPDGKCLRYKRLASYECFNANSLIDKVKLYIGMIKEDLKESPIRGNLARIVCGDARKLSTKQYKLKFDLCITSPPYLNSFDYSDVYRPEMFLAGFVSNNNDLMKIRLRTMRSHVQANWEMPTQNSFGAIYKKVFRELVQKKDVLWSKRLLKMIQAYFEDIETLLKALRLQANQNAILKIAVGTSAYAGTVVPVDLIIAEIAENSGWLLKDIKVVRRLRSSPQLWKHEEWEKVPELRESIILLRTSSQNLKY